MSYAFRKPTFDGNQECEISLNLGLCGRYGGAHGQEKRRLVTLDGPSVASRPLSHPTRFRANWPNSCHRQVRVTMTSTSEGRFTPVEIRTAKGRTFRVREYTLDDFKGLVEMYKGFEPKRVAQGLPPPDVRRIAHWLDQLQNKSRSLLALCGKRIVAQAILCPISDASMEFTVFVHQDLRGAGLGTALASLATEFAHK